MSVSTIGRWNYLLHLSSFLVYLDLLLALGKGVSLGELTLEWLRLNVTVGTALMALVSYSFVKGFLLPVADFLYFAAAALPVMFVRLRKPAARDEVPINTWRDYALISRSTPAYREIERIRSKNDETLEDASSSFHLALLLLGDLIVGRLVGKSLVLDLVTFVGSQQGSARFLLLLPLLLFSGALAYQALVAPLAVRVSVTVLSQELLNDVQKTVGTAKHEL